MAIIDVIQSKVVKDEYEFAIPHFFEEMDDFGEDLHMTPALLHKVGIARVGGCKKTGSFVDWA